MDRDLVLPRAGARRVALASLAVAIAVALAKLVTGIVTGSLAVLSEALHSTLDAGVTGLTLYAVRLADKPPDREHPYGHGRAENLAALAEAGVLVALGGVLAVEAVRHLTSGEAIHVPGYALAVMAGSIVVDVWRSRALHRAARRYDSQALEADAKNFTADVLGSFAVLVGLAASRLGFPAADPLAALVIVALIAGMGVRLGASAVNVLMDRAPEGLDDDVRAAALSVDGVVDVGPVLVRKSGPHAIAEVSVSVGRTLPVERSHGIAEDVRDAIARAVPGTRSVVRVAPSPEGEDVVGRVFAAANRVGLADQVHNVLAVHHVTGTWLMLHAKVDPDVTLARADEITDRLEEELRREIAGLDRVEIHLEPRESQSLAGDVSTSRHPELVAEVAALASGFAPIRRCHEVAVSEVAQGALYVVLHCEAAPECTIAAVHEASLRLEDAIHRRYPKVASVTVHFEPAGGLGE